MKMLRSPRLCAALAALLLAGFPAAGIAERTARTLDRDLEKTVRKLRDQAAAGGRAAKGETREHYRRAAEEFSSALGEPVRKAKHTDYDRPGRRLRGSDGLDDARRAARKLLDEAEKRGRAGDADGEAARLRASRHLAAGVREFHAARIADALR